jgi:YfiH family protein
MKFVDIDKYTFCHYSIFDNIDGVRAYTNTSVNSAELLPFNNDHKNKWEPPDWMNKTGINPDSVARIKQIHGSTIKYARSPGYLGEADGLISDQTGLYLRIVTADCLPVFLYDKRLRTFGIVHAGWRGLEKGIIEKAAAEMNKAFGSTASDLIAAVGPFIQSCCYEVGEEVANNFLPECSTKKPNGKYNLDLGIVLIKKIEQVRIPACQIEVSKICTFCEEKRLHSFRRDGPKAGRLTSIIGIAGN